MDTISIEGLDKAAVLAALYNRSRPQGMGFLHYNPAPMTVEEAQNIIDERTGSLYFDYLQGRVMKVDLSEDSLNTRGFNRDNGQGAAESVIEELRSTGNLLTEESVQEQKLNTLAALDEVRGAPRENTIVDTPEGFSIFTLGLGDIADFIESIDEDLLK